MSVNCGNCIEQVNMLLKHLSYCQSHKRNVYCRYYNDLVLKPFNIHAMTVIENEYAPMIII